ncbi:hypothetical protein DFH07DRAFT_783093 [Mycena maculata]|uniref:Uncharacterized protein n=1 Tax=Mycena maculata TaxID=230809 RepID=A0AAD7MNH7_9AGAR|nr:hypothetical protein DFH07DRAFT_783093 [Mycena maculata]
MILRRFCFFDDTHDLPDQLSSEGPDHELSDAPITSEAPLDISLDSDDDILDIPTLVGIKRLAPATASKAETKGPRKKTKPAPAMSIPAAAAAVVPPKNKSAKDRFSATIVAKEETHQQALVLKKERNDARKEVALKNIQMDGEVRLAKARSKQVEKERKLNLARLKMEQEHQFRMEQLQTHAGPSSMSGGSSSGGGTSQDDNFYPGLYVPVPAHASLSSFPLHRTASLQNLLKAFTSRVVAAYRAYRDIAAIIENPVGCNLVRFLIWDVDTEVLQRVESALDKTYCMFRADAKNRDSDMARGPRAFYTVL